MKRIFLLLCLVCFTKNISAQTYEVDRVFSNAFSNFNISHFKLIEGTKRSDVPEFSCWSTMRLSDEGSSYINLDLFSGDAKEIYSSLMELNNFAKSKSVTHKTSHLTFIKGVKVEYHEFLSMKAFSMYDKEGKYFTTFNRKDFDRIVKKFVEYCEKEQVAYQ